MSGFQTGTQILARQKESPSRALEQSAPTATFGGGNSPVRHEVVISPADWGKVAVWDKDGYLAVGAADGVSTVVISDVAPDPVDGQLWWDSTAGLAYIWYDDGTSAQWVSFVPGGGGSTGVIASVTPPANPPDNQLWFDTAGGALYIWYNDGTSRQWIATR